MSEQEHSREPMELELPVRKDGPILRAIGRVFVITPAGPAGTPKPLFTEKKLRGWLKRLVGHPYDEEAARHLVLRRYEHLGYDARVALSFDGDILEVRITEAPGLVNTLTVGPQQLEGKLPPALLEDADPITKPHVPLRTLRTRAGSLINRERLARDAYDLGLIGYTIVPVPPGRKPPGRNRRRIRTSQRLATSRW